MHVTIVRVFLGGGSVVIVCVVGGYTVYPRMTYSTTTITSNDSNTNQKMTNIAENINKTHFQKYC